MTGDEELILALREALRHEADAVQPNPDGLRLIRATLDGDRVAADHLDPAPAEAVPARRWRRQWLPVAAAAATVLLVSVLASGWLGPHPADPIIAEEVPAAAVQDALPLPAVAPLPVYFVERQGTRWALVREFEATTLTDPDQRLRQAVQLAVAGLATDPDYTSVWRRLGLTGPVTTARTKDTLTVVLGRGLLPSPRSSFADDDLPTLAGLAVDQLVWTATATTRATLPVVVRGEAAGQTLLGSLTLDESFRRVGGAGDPRAPASISTLTHGELLRVGRATISGDATTPASGGISWTLLQLPAIVPGQPLGSPGGPGGTAALTLDDGSPARPGQRGSWRIHVTLPEPGEYTLIVHQDGSDWLETKQFTVR